MSLVMRKRIKILLITTLLLQSCASGYNKQESVEQCLALFYIENQNDSILNIVHTLNSKGQVSNIHTILEAAALCEKGNMDGAKKTFEKIDEKELNTIDKYWYSHIEGLILFREKEYAKSYQILQTVLNQPELDIRATALSQRIIARILLLNNNRECIGWLAQSSESFRKAGLEKSVGINDKILGRFYMNVNNNKAAFECFSKSKKILEKYQDKLELYYIYINLLDYYIIANDLEKANYYANLCLPILHEYGDNQMKVVLYNNLGEIFLKQGKDNLAKEYFNKTIDIPPTYVGTKIRVGNAFIFLSQIALKEGDSRKATHYALQAENLFIDTHQYPESKKKVYSNLSIIYGSNRTLHQKYADSVAYYNEMLQREQIESDRKLYETQSELLKTNFSLQQLRIKNKQKKQTLLIVELFAAFIIIALLFYYSSERRKVKALKALAQKNIELADNHKEKMKSIQNQLEKSTNNRKKLDPDKQEELYSNIIHYLIEQKNFKRQEIGLDILASELNTNREYISQAINANNLTFNKLLRQIRIDEAIRILSDKNHPLHQAKFSHIAYELGYKSDKIFTSNFNKQTGMNPSEFRIQDKGK